MLAFSPSRCPCHWPKTSSAQWSYIDKEKKQTLGRKTREENRKKIFRRYLFRKKIADKKRAFSNGQV
jgi:hypothetical protein